VTQDELKTLVGRAALHYVPLGEIVGVGTGSTVNQFIEALAGIKDQVKGAVSSSMASTERLRAVGIKVFDANEVGELAVYIDGADEIDRRGYMIKGGSSITICFTAGSSGSALTIRCGCRRCSRRIEIDCSKPTWRASSSASPTKRNWSACSENFRCRWK